MPKPKLLVFDMDGVLVDVSASYRPAIAATVRDYFSLVLGLPDPPADLVTLAELDLLKRAGGLNNDWDMAAACIAYILSLLPPARAGGVETATVLQEWAGGDGAPGTDAVLRELRLAAGGLAGDWPAVLERKDFPRLAQAAAQRGGGLEGVQEAAGPANRRLLSYRSSAALTTRGTLQDVDLVTRLFQEHYLGGELFEATYGLEPRFVHEEAGLYRRERLLIAPETLARLAARYPLGIATGRPRAEAVSALAYFGVHHLFRCVVTEAEVQEAEERALRETGRRPSLRKPHPYLLLAALAGLGGQESALGGYVGDTLDDIRTARAAHLTRPVLAVGCCAAAQDREETRRAFAAAGADLIVEDLEELARWLLE